MTFNIVKQLINVGVLLNDLQTNLSILVTWGQFHQRSTRSFYVRRSRKRKIPDKLSVSF